MNDEVRFDKIDQKLDKIIESIGEMNVQMAVMNTELKYHVRRSDRLEEISQIQKEEFEAFRTLANTKIDKVAVDIEMGKTILEQNNKTKSTIWKLAVSGIGIIVTAAAIVCNNSALLQAVKVWFAP